MTSQAVSSNVRVWPGRCCSRQISGFAMSPVPRLTPSRTNLLQLMRQLCDSGLTLIVSSHDWGSDLDRYDQVLVLDRALLAQGAPETVRRSLGDLRVGHECCG